MALVDAVAERVDLGAAGRAPTARRAGREAAGGAHAAAAAAAAVPEVGRLQADETLGRRLDLGQHGVRQHRDPDEAARAQLLLRVQLVGALQLRDLREENCS